MSFNEYFFLRNAEVVIGERVKGTNAPVEPKDGRRYGKDSEGYSFRIVFKIEKDETGKANKSEIKIYNLSHDSQNFLERENLVVFLRAGYGNTLSNIFFGDIIRANSKREGADVVTIIECGDAEEVLRTANIQIGLASGATNRQIFKMAADKLLVSNGFIDELPEITYHNGFSYSGQVSKLLDQLTKQVNYKWSIQDGEIVVLGPKKTDQTNAVFLSQDTGLIGYPFKTKDGVEFEAFLHPDIRPGRAVVVESSRFMKGQGQTIRVTKSVHEGDTHGDKWVVKAEGAIV